jgi:hypothetical protein
MDTLKQYTIHHKDLPGFNYKHEFRDVLFYIFRRAGVFMKKETSLNFLTDAQEGMSTFRPTIVLVYG